MGKNGKNANQKKRKQTLKSLIIRENKYINIEEKPENNKWNKKTQRNVRINNKSEKKISDR